MFAELEFQIDFPDTQADGKFPFWAPIQTELLQQKERILTMMI